MVETYRVQYDLYDRGISRMIIPFGYAPEKLADTETINEGLKQMVRQYGGNPDDFAHLTGATFKTATIETKRNWARRAGLDYFDGFTDDQVVDDWSYHLFPNVTLNTYSDICFVQRWRSEEHTSELQSLMRISYAVFCLKKKTKTINQTQEVT